MLAGGNTILISESIANPVGSPSEGVVPMRTTPSFPGHHPGLGGAVLRRPLDADWAAFATGGTPPMAAGVHDRPPGRRESLEHALRVIALVKWTAHRHA